MRSSVSEERPLEVANFQLSRYGLGPNIWKEEVVSFGVIIICALPKHHTPLRTKRYGKVGFAALGKGLSGSEQ